MLNLERLALFSLLSLGTFFSLSNCKTPKPSSDSTPPTVKWTVLNKANNEQKEITGDGKIDAKQGNTFKVTCIAEDSGGVHEISLSDEVQWTCKSAGSLASTSGPSLGTPEKQTLNPDSNGDVLTTIFINRDETLGPYACQSNWNLSSATLTLSCSGENYYNGITKAQLVFNVTP